MTRDELLELLLVERFGPTPPRKARNTTTRKSNVEELADPLPEIARRRRALRDTTRREERTA